MALHSSMKQIQGEACMSKTINQGKPCSYPHILYITWCQTGEYYLLLCHIRESTDEHPD